MPVFLPVLFVLTAWEEPGKRITEAGNPPDR
jgi:hypothetical protein